MKKLVLDPRAEELLRIVPKHVGPLGVKYAVGGAIAMAMQGFSRNTTDVDLFIRDEDRPRVLRALREAGLDVAEVYDRLHYIAVKPSHGDIEIRIDVMVPFDEPDWSAVECPKPVLVDDTYVLPIIQADFIAAMKFYSKRDKDALDLSAMHARGVFDPEKVAELIGSMDPEGRVEWEALVRRMGSPRSARPRPPRR